LRGVTVRPCATVDGLGAAELVFDAVELGADARLDAGDARLSGAGLAAIERVLDRSRLVACAESVGAMRAALAATVAYTRTRQQFGKPLAFNQALRHRMADLSIACEEAHALTLGAIHTAEAAESADRPSARARAAAGAWAKVGAAARRAGEEAIQLHGGMGVTEELSVGTYLRRQLALEAMLGSPERSLRRHASLRAAAGSDGRHDDPPIPAPSGFRDEVRAFLARALTPDMVRAQHLGTSVFSEPEVGLRWHRALHAQGWIAPAWPAEYGGTGWSLAQRWIFETECARAGAPALSPLGLRMAGPVIMRFGTPEQKAHYLPRMLAGDDYWCQGYSEPGSGSDLASLKTRAERRTRADGAEVYVINGSKIWTTHAHHANRMFALVRTGATDARKQDGISFLLIDMATPGITVRPIRSMSGDHEVNQVFFDDVEVPVSCRLGDEGQGWAIAKYLLEFERGGAISAGRLQAALDRVRRLAASAADVGPDPLADPDLALTLSAIELDVEALQMTELRVMSTLQTGQNPGSVSSLLKLRWSEIHQAITRVGVRVLGPDALAWEHTRPLYQDDTEAVLGELARPIVAGYLNARAFTIFGGTSEIQREIIARELLG
jgi:alkylation response protein AidB-like acyl-CoA dehydrogenase